MIDSVICGDCFEVLPDIIGQVPRPVIVTDPPFNIGYHYDACKDKKPEDEYYGDLARLLLLAPAVVVHYPEALYKLAFEMGVFPERVVSWVYNSNTAKQHRDIAYFRVRPDFAGLGEYKNPTDKRIAERIAAGKKPRGYDWVYCNQVKNVSKDKTAHPCQMPVELMEYVVRSIPEDCTIVDPFAGSGTTLVAARNNNRRYVGVELSGAYCEIIKGRLGA